MTEFTYVKIFQIVNSSNINDASNIKVRCGEWDTRSLNEHYDHQDRIAQKIMTHPGFKPYDLHNDVSIIVVKDPFILDSHIGTICLPDQVHIQFLRYIF